MPLTQNPVVGISSRGQASSCCDGWLAARGRSRPSGARHAPCGRPDGVASLRVAARGDAWTNILNLRRSLSRAGVWGGAPRSSYYGVSIRKLSALPTNGHLRPVIFPGRGLVEHGPEHLSGIGLMVEEVSDLLALGSADTAEDLPADRKPEQEDVSPPYPVPAVEPVPFPDRVHFENLEHLYERGNYAALSSEPISTPASARRRSTPLIDSQSRTSSPWTMRYQRVLPRRTISTRHSPSGVRIAPSISGSTRPTLLPRSSQDHELQTCSSNECITPSGRDGVA